MTEDAALYLNDLFKWKRRYKISTLSFFSYSRNRNHLTFQNSLVDNDAIHRYYAEIGGVVALVWNY